MDKRYIREIITLDQAPSGGYSGVRWGVVWERVNKDGGKTLRLRRLGTIMVQSH